MFLNALSSLGIDMCSDVIGLWSACPSLYSLLFFGVLVLVQWPMKIFSYGFLVVACDVGVDGEALRCSVGRRFSL